MKPSVLCVDQLKKDFITSPWWRRIPCKIVAVNDISFSLAEGEILGFLGSNGSGKTTTIQMLLGVMEPTSGTISYFGQDLRYHRQEILQQVTFASAYARLIGRLTVLENLYLAGYLFNLNMQQMKERVEYLLKFFSMWDVRDRLAGGLSAGQTTRVMLVRAFLPRPRVVLLDEPTASLDPEIALEVRRFVLHQQREEGVSVLFTSHNMEEVAETCDRVLVLKAGTIIANDTPENLARSIATARVCLMVGDGLKRTEQYAQQKGLRYIIKGRLIEMEVDEHKIASLLNALAKIPIEYTNISIDKPRLEDYFIHVVRKKH